MKARCGCEVVQLTADETEVAHAVETCRDPAVFAEPHADAGACGYRGEGPPPWDIRAATPRRVDAARAPGRFGPMPRLPRSSWTIEARTPHGVLIRDTGGQLSVTNDAETVVAMLLAAGDLHPGQRLFYFDSEGRLDELVHDGSKFTGFKPGPADGVIP